MIYKRASIGNCGRTDLFVYACHRSRSAVEIGLGIESADKLQLRHVSQWQTTFHEANLPGFLRRVRKYGCVLPTGPLAEYFHGAAHVAILNELPTIPDGTPEVRFCVAGFAQLRDVLTHVIAHTS